MAARAWHTAEVLSQQTTNSEYPTFVSACDLTFTPDANSTYVLFATGCHGYSNSVGSSSVKVAFYSASLDPKVWFTDQLSFLPRVVQPGKSFLCAGVISFGAAPPEFTCTVGFSAEGTIYTAYIKDVRITAFKLEQDDKGIFNSGSISTTSTSWQDAASLTFTPPSAGDYLIITRATLRTNYAGASAIISAVLDVDGTESGQGQLCARSILTQSSWGTIQKVTLPASSKTIKIKYRTNDALREVHIADRVLIALRLSDFGGALYVEDNTVASTTANKLQTYITLNESFDSGDWLLMGVAQTAGDNIGREYEDVLRLGSKNLQSAIIRPESVYAWGEIETYACFSVQQAYDGSAKPNLAYRRSSLICTVYVTNGRIAALNLGASPPPPPVSFIPNVMIHKSIPSFLGGLN